MIRPAASALLLLLLVAASPARAETVLHLSATATHMVAPDELDATLRAEAVSANPADAQQRVNALTSEALAAAHQVPGVTVSTGGYTVWRIGPTQQDRSERWQAGQSLTLKSHDGAALLKLVGALQQKGLATGQLNWRLSPETERKAHTEAMEQALSSLRERVDKAAALLGLRFGSYKEVRLDSAEPRPVPRLMNMATSMSAAAAPPQAESTDIPVSATVEADAILLPR